MRVFIFGFQLLYVYSVKNCKASVIHQLCNKVTFNDKRDDERHDDDDVVLLLVTHVAVTDILNLTANE